MSKTKINWHRISKLQYNSEVFKAWCELEIQDGRTEYYNTNIIVLENINQPVEEMNKENIQKYFDNDKGSANTKNKKLAALKAFFTYIADFPEYKDKDFNILPQRYAKGETLDLNVGKPLTLDEFIDLRNMVMQKKTNQKWALMLELFYVFGFRIKDLRKFTNVVYDYKKGMFIKDSNTYKLSKSMVDMLIENPTLVDSVTEQNPHSAFAMMSQRFNRNIKWLDIYAMHEKYSMCCPICGEKYANDMDYWVIAERPDDVLQKKWLICCNCCERIKSNEKL